MKIKVILATSLLLLTTTSNAAIPVIDVASIGRLVTQFKQLEAEYTLLKGQFDSLNGDTAFSGFMKDTVKDAHSFIPTTINSDIRDVIKNGSGVSGLKNLAEDLKEKHLEVSASDIFTHAAKDSEAKKRFTKEADEIFSGMAAAQNHYNKSGERKTYLDQLRKSIKNAQSPKEREQLLLRITVENSLLLNDLQQLMAFQMLTEHQRRASQFNDNAVIRKARPTVKLDY